MLRVSCKGWKSAGGVEGKEAWEASVPTALRDVNALPAPLRGFTSAMVALGVSQRGR